MQRNRQSVVVQRGLVQKRGKSGRNARTCQETVKSSDLSSGSTIMVERSVGGLELGISVV